MFNEPVLILYTNWRGETEYRKILPTLLFFGSHEKHSTPQWLLRAQDLHKNEERTFAMKDIHRWYSEKLMDRLRKPLPLLVVLDPPSGVIQSVKFFDSQLERTSFAEGVHWASREIDSHLRFRCLDPENLETELGEEPEVIERLKQGLAKVMDGVVAREPR